jgi:hypothetical protein
MDSFPYSKDELAFAADLETASPFRFSTQLLERNPRRKLALCELLDHERGCGRLDLPVLQIFFSLEADQRARTQSFLSDKLCNWLARLRL